MHILKSFENAASLYSLKESSSDPLYLQLKQVLIQLIQKGSLASGDQIPSEYDLAEFFHVSRNTVRSAILELCQEGYLTRRQGKGTFIKHTKVAENVAVNRSFAEVCLANGITPSHKLLKLALQEPSDLDMKVFDIGREDRIIYIKRLLFGNHIPVILDQTFLHQKYAAVLKENLDDVSLYETLTRLFNLTLLRTHKTIELAYASEKDATDLKIKRESPVLLMHETVFDENGQPVHRSRQIILGDRFKYEVY